MWNGINNKCGSKDANEDIVLIAYLISNGRKTRLLVVQEVSYDHPKLVFVLDS